ncbi:MAG: hypothetical protein ACYS47_16250, partial [Planctomycetota bacterium]
FPGWSKLRVKVEGVTVTYFLNDEQALSQATEIQNGGIYFRVMGEGYVKFRNLKIKIDQLQ